MSHKNLAEPGKAMVETASGVYVPASLIDSMVPMSEIVPNDWNPNRMEAFMRTKLSNSIKVDGFVMPVLVRPIECTSRKDLAALVSRGVKWEIVDGEHRWDEGSKIGMGAIPIVNLGTITDSQAKQITVKANALRGDFDSVKLAEMVHELVKDVGMAELVDSLPYTSERLQAMVDLLSVDTTSINLPAHGDRSDGDDDASEKEDGGEFKSFNGGDMEFDHKCPRCSFEFNAAKGS